MNSKDAKARSLAERLRDPELYGDACDEAAERLDTLERELAAANKERDDALAMLGVYKLGCDEQKERIRRLQDAGEAMFQQFRHPALVTHNWTKAKEGKP